MQNKNYPTELTDKQWDCIKAELPPPKPGGRKRTTELRQVLNAIFYLVRGGIARQLGHLQHAGGFTKKHGGHVGRAVRLINDDRAIR